MHDSLFSSPVKPLKVIVNASPSRFVFASLQKEQRGKHVNSKEDQIGNNTYEFVVWIKIYYNNINDKNRTMQFPLTWASMQAFNCDFCRPHFSSLPWFRARQLRNVIISFIQGFWRFPNFFGLIYKVPAFLPIIPWLMLSIQKVRLS